MSITSLISFFLLFIQPFLLFTSSGAFAQQVLSQLEIEGGAWSRGFEFLSKDSIGNYYAGALNYDTGKEGIIVGDSLIKAHRHDPEDFNLALCDFYLLKFNAAHEFQNSFVIDNAELVRDFYTTGKNSFISMTLIADTLDNDQHPITLGGESVIDREGNRGKGVLVILDENMDLQKAIILSTGESGQVTAYGDYAYLEFRIPDYEPFILIGEDTVFNQVYTDDPDFYGQQTVVLCKYNFISEEIEWWQRIGNTGYEELLDMEMDSDHNLIIRGITSSTYFFFDDSTVTINNSFNNPFIGKYSPVGEYIFGILNANEVIENCHDFTMDKEGNFYLISDYYGLHYAIGDTLLVNPFLEDKYPYRGMVVKYDAAGDFKWAVQLDGAFEISYLHSVTILNETDLCIAGLFWEGQLHLGGQEFHHAYATGDESTFLWLIDQQTGAYKNHIMTSGANQRRFYNISVDQDGMINMYMVFGGTDTIFDHVFSSHAGFPSGILLKLNADFSTAVPEVPGIQHGISLYPNPVPQGSEVLLYIDQFDKAPLLDFMLFDQAGRMVSIGTTAIMSDLYSIPTNGLPIGSYWLIIGSNECQQVGHIIVE